MSRKAVGLKDLNFSFNGESQNQTAFSPEYVPQMPVHEINNEFIILKLVKPKKGRLHFDGTDNNVRYKDEKTGREVKTTVRVLKGIDSIWYKDQKDIPQEVKNVSGQSLLFEDSFCQVRKAETQWIEFINVCSSNIHSPNFDNRSKYPFYVYDSEMEAQSMLDKELEEANAIVSAQNQDDEKMIKHASFLGIQLHDKYGLPKKPKAIRAEYISLAKRNPAHFRKTLGSKEIEVFSMVQKAILQSLIDVGGTDGRCYWSNNGGMICIIPRNENPLKYLVEFALLEQTESKNFLSTLKEVVK